MMAAIKIMSRKCPELSKYDPISGHVSAPNPQE
jgi:hypothetical protein